MRGPRIGPKGASRGSEKIHLLGASPCSSTPQGGPLYGWKKRGIFAVVGSGQRGLRVCLHVRQVPAHRAQVFEPRGGRGLLIAGCKCPAGSRNGMGTPPDTKGAWPVDSSWEIARSSGWRGGLPFPDRCLGTLCKWSDSSRVGLVSPGRRVLGSLSAHARPTNRPERSQPQLGEKPSPGGLPMVLHSSRRTP